ncbi:MAG: NAD+ synthase [Chloroflexaceae bacterium]|jgi:NAD+ synthetase|nr:NAD+ synthase [Chloroflexaceae bacterium]
MQLNLALAQLRPKKGDYMANLARLQAVFAQLASLPQRPDVLVLPETFLTGYFLEGGVRDVARPAGQVAAELDAAYRVALGDSAPPLDIVVGFYERYRDHYYNSALYATLGKNQEPRTENQPQEIGSRFSVLGSPVKHVHRKVFLPTYGVFDEARFVEAGHQIAAFDTAWGRAAILICEDAWHNVSGTIAALDGAQMVFLVSASPARGMAGTRPSNVEHWEDLARRIADEHGMFVALAQLVGFEGGKGFPGGSFVMGPRGDVLVNGPLWDDALITATIELDDLPLARADTPLLADLGTMLPHIQAELARAGRRESAAVAWDSGMVNAELRMVKTQHDGSMPPSQFLILNSQLPVVQAPAFDPTASEILTINPELTRRWLVEFLRDEVTRRRGFQDVVIALSGGVDSALVAYLCAEAFGPQHVLAIRMPYRTSSRESLEHAQLVIDDLGLRSTIVDISAAVDGYASLDPEMDGRRKGNIMARTRMIVLFDHSQKLGALPIGTGNKTERLFGYYTWHADDSPPVNPLGDLFKSQVWQLSRHVGVPSVIVEKPASADLIVGQTDEADFGISYPQADRILHFLLQGYPPERLANLGFAPTEVALVKRRLDSTHWKRHLPSAAMLSSTAIGEYYLRPLDY